MCVRTKTNLIDVIGVSTFSTDNKTLKYSGVF